MKEDVSLGIELTVKETQRHLLRMLLRRESTCNEIRHLADKILLGSRGKHNWEKRILQERIQMKANEIRNTRIKWRQASAKIQVILSPQEASEYRSIKREEINWIWTEHRRHKKEKLHWLASQETLTHIEGIPNTDWELEQSCGPTVHEGLVLGNLQVSEAVKAFLRLDPKFRVYGKLDKEEFETQTEVTAYNQRLSRKEDRGETVSQEDRK